MMAPIGAGLSTVVASPVFALARDDGDSPGDPLSTLEALLYFVVLPVAAFALIALLVSLPGMVRGPRYRPGRGWDAGPQWYGAPADTPEAAAAEDAPTEAGPSAGPSAVTAGEARTPEQGDGGASARW